MMVIGAVALIVIGPEKLPRVARTVGTLLGKAQRYVADVKAEVNRSIELEELQRMKSQFETAARDVQQTVHQHVGEAGDHLRRTYGEVSDSVTGSSSAPVLGSDGSIIPSSVLPPAYRPPKKNWRLKRSATPQWFKQRAGVRVHAQSGAARVARFRPRPPASR